MQTKDLIERLRKVIRAIDDHALEGIESLYPDTECPDCGEPIPEGVTEGEECENCGHVFFNVHENSPSDYNSDPDQWN